MFLITELLMDSLVLQNKSKPWDSSNSIQSLPLYLGMLWTFVDLNSFIYKWNKICKLREEYKVYAQYTAQSIAVALPFPSIQLGLPLRQSF